MDESYAIRRYEQAAALLPLRWQQQARQLPPRQMARAEELRLRTGGPMTVLLPEGEITPGQGGQSPTVTQTDLEQLCDAVTDYSRYAAGETLSRGYLTARGGFRVGVCGTAVAEGGQVRSLRDITALVYRIPRQVPGCGDRLFLEGCPLERGVLVVGPPSSGKTTFLRDVARSLSLGRFGPSRRVAVVDERGELGGYDLGPNADVLRGYPKAAGLDAAIRTLSPEVAVLDELSQGDLEAVRGAAAAGVVLLASVHGEAEHLSQRPLCRALVESGAFGTAVCLSGRGAPGEVAALVPVGPEGGVGRHEAFGSGAAGGQRAAGGPGRGGAPQAPGPAAA